MPSETNESLTDEVNGKNPSPELVKKVTEKVYLRFMRDLKIENERRRPSKTFGRRR